MFVDIFFNLSAWSIILFVVGIILLIIEMFQPGFGVFGFSGLAVLIVDVVISARSVTHGVALGIFLLGVLLLLAIVFFVLLSTGNLPKGLILKNNEDVVSGYVGVPDYRALVGQTGTAHTTLRPAGTARIGDMNFSVVTEGDFIQKDAPIRVKAVSGVRIVVEQADPEQK